MNLHDSSQSKLIGRSVHGGVLVVDEILERLSEVFVELGGGYQVRSALNRNKKREEPTGDCCTDRNMLYGCLVPGFILRVNPRGTRDHVPCESVLQIRSGLLSVADDLYIRR